jgi:hypothetical protein
MRTTPAGSEKSRLVVDLPPKVVQILEEAKENLGLDHAAVIKVAIHLFEREFLRRGRENHSWPREGTSPIL